MYFWQILLKIEEAAILRWIGTKLQNFRVSNTFYCMLVMTGFYMITASVMKESRYYNIITVFFCIRTTQNMKFSIKDFFSKCDQIRRKLPIWSHLLKKSLIENFIFCAVLIRVT